MLGSRRQRANAGELEGIGQVNQQPLEQVVRNIDARLERVEQILPTLATKAELHAAIDNAVAPLATKVELQEVRAELRAEIREGVEQTRRHFDMVAERMEDHMRLLAEGHMSEKARLDRTIAKNAAEHEKFDRRLMRLEGKRRR